MSPQYAERRPGEEAAHKVGGEHDTITVPPAGDSIRLHRLYGELRAARHRGDPVAVQVLAAKLTRARTAPRRLIVLDAPTAPEPQVSTVSNVLPTGMRVPPAPRKAKPAGRRRHTNRAGRR